MQPQPTPEQQKSNKKILMIVVAVALLGIAGFCCIVMAAVGLPAFIEYTKKSKAAEAEQNLRFLYNAADAYYSREFAGPTGEMLTHCTVDSAVTANQPSSASQSLAPLPPSFAALEFPAERPMLYQYEIESVGGCGHPPGTHLYTFFARGDLDDDGQQSLYELSVTVDSSSNLSAAPVNTSDALE